MDTRPSELSILASLLTNATTQKGIQTIDSRWFGEPRFKTALEIMQEMYEKEEAIDVITFSARWTEKYPETGIEDVINFSRNFKSSHLINSYANVVRDGAVKRHANEALEMTKHGITKGENSETILGRLDKLSRELQDIAGEKHLPQLSNIMAEVTNMIVDENNPDPIEIGLEQIDKHGGYLYDMMLLAARYGVGKTPFALRTVLSNCIHKQIPTAIFSGENPNKMIVMALLSMMTGVPLKSITMGIKHLGDVEKKQLIDAQEKIMDSPLYFCNWGYIDYYTLKGEMSHFHEKHGTKVHIIDAYPHINLNMQVHRNRNDALIDLANKIVLFKKEMPGFYMVLDQLKTKNVDDTPSLRDVMHSTQFEQNTDVGIVIDRKDKEKRRMDREKRRLDWDIKQIQFDNTLSENEKAMKVYELHQTSVIAGVAHVYQEKGRMGYGEWRTEVGFDDAAYGFYDRNSIHPEDPRKEQLLQRLKEDVDEQKKEIYDPEDF